MSTQIQASSYPGATTSHNLWNNALSTLSADIRNSIDLTTNSRAEVIAKVLKIAQEKQQLCAQKAFTFKRRNGSTVILRDVFAKIVLWIEKFSKVGDAAMPYDPHHAAPAWAAFRFVLQVKPLTFRKTTWY